MSQPHSNYIDDLFIETSGIDLGLINKPNCLRIAQAQLEKKNLFIFVYLINRANYNLLTCDLIKIKLLTCNLLYILLRSEEHTSELQSPC